MNNLKEPDDGFVMGSDHLDSCNNYSLSTGRLPISHRMETSLLSGSCFDDGEETRYLKEFTRG